MSCPRCGAHLADADLQNPNCRYCGALHPHMARAAEKVEVVKQLLAPGPGGMPVAMAAMMGQTGPAPHRPPMPPGSGIVMVNGSVVQTGPAPPQMAGYGAAPYAAAPFGAAPFGAAPYAAAPFALHAQHAARSGMRVAMVIAVVVAVLTLLAVGGLVAFVSL